MLFDVGRLLFLMFGALITYGMFLLGDCGMPSEAVAEPNGYGTSLIFNLVY